MISTQIIWALALIILTVAVQGVIIDVLLTRVTNMARGFSRLIGTGWRMFFCTAVTLILAVPHLFAILIWALFYMHIAAGEEVIPLETALYFSGSAYTTVGFGDITMTPDWRFISTMESLSGLLLLAGSAATLVEIFARLYRNMPARPHEKKPTPKAPRKTKP